MSKKKREPVVSETVTDPQAIAAAMEDTVDVVSETVPAHGIDANGVDRGPVAVAGKLSTHDLEDAMQQWDLKPADVLAWRGFTPEAESVLVTHGGKKLRWPADEAHVLTAAEKGHPVKHPGEYPGGYLRRKADH